MVKMECWCRLSLRNELGNAIQYILNHPDEAHKMSQVSLEIGRAHDEQLTFQAYDEFYRSLGNNSKSS